MKSEVVKEAGVADTEAHLKSEGNSKFFSCGKLLQSL